MQHTRNHQSRTDVVRPRRQEGRGPESRHPAAGQSGRYPQRGEHSHPDRDPGHEFVQRVEQDRNFDMQADEDILRGGSMHREVGDWAPEWAENYYGNRSDSGRNDYPNRQVPWTTGGYGNGQGGTRDYSYEQSRDGTEPRAGGDHHRWGQDLRRGSNYAGSGYYRDNGNYSRGVYGSSYGSGVLGEGGQPGSSSWRDRNGPKGYVRSDERIKDDVCERLCQHQGIDVGDVSVEVSNGCVKLDGSVSSRDMKHRIEDIVDDCIGVQEVDNRLSVTRNTGDTTGKASTKTA